MNLKRNRMFFQAGCLLLAFLLSACHLQDMETGKRAFRQGDYETSLAHLRPLAEFGVPEAQAQLGKHYMLGKGVEKDGQKALALLEQAEAGREGTQYQRDITRLKVQMATRALAGDSDMLTQAEGLEVLRAAAEENDKNALFELGRACEKGIGIQPNGECALYYYKKASVLGYGRADYHLAQLYEKGHLVPQDITRAIQLYEEAAAKEYNKANFRLATLRQP